MGVEVPRPTVPTTDAEVLATLRLFIGCGACKPRAAGSANLVGCTIWVRAGTPTDLNNGGTGALDTQSSIGLCRYGVVPKADCDMCGPLGSFDVGEANLVEESTQELCAIDDLGEFTSTEALKDGFLELLPLLLDLPRLLTAATHSEPLVDRSGEDLFL